MSAVLTEKFWRLVAQDNSPEPTAFDLMIFSSLGDPWSEDTIWAKKFTEELWQLPKSVKRLNLHINSVGGAVSEAMGIYSALADHPSEKIVYIDGIAASAATIPAMVGHKVFIRSNANMMIHSPSALVIGPAKAMRDAISMLESVTESIVNVYAKKSGLPRDELRSLMEAETWFTAQEAVDRGFADEVRGVIKAAASLDSNRVIFNGTEFNLQPFRYRNIPAFPVATINPMNKPDSPSSVAAAAPAPPKEPKPKQPPKEVPKEEPEDLPLEDSPPQRDEVNEEVAAIWRQFPRGARMIREHAVSQERDRLSALDQFDNVVCASIVAEAKVSGKTANEIALACYKAMASARDRDARRSDAKALDAISPGEAPFQPIRPAAAKPNNGKDRSQAVNLLINAGKNDARKLKKGTN